jgi:hypothetical protein
MELALFTGSTFGVQRQWLWAAIPFTFIVKKINAGCGRVHVPLSSIKKFQTLSLQEVYYPPLPIYYRVLYT